MATILEVKPIDRVTTKDSKSEMLTFFGIMREKKEYEMLQAMKDVADAKYKIKSFKRQIKEIEKNIAKLKSGKPIPVPKPLTLVPLMEPTPTIKVAKPLELHTYYTTTPTISPASFVKPAIFVNRSSDNVSDHQTYNHSWKCEKCNGLQFSSRKLLKVHISDLHSY